MRWCMCGQQDTESTGVVGIEFLSASYWPGVECKLVCVRVAAKPHSTHGHHLCVPSINSIYSTQYTTSRIVCIYFVYCMDMEIVLLSKYSKTSYPKMVYEAFSPKCLYQF